MGSEDHDNDPSTPLQLIISGTVDANNVNDAYPLLSLRKTPMDNVSLIKEEKSPSTDQMNSAWPTHFDSQTVCEGHKSMISHTIMAEAQQVLILAGQFKRVQLRQHHHLLPRVVFQLF